MNISRDVRFTATENGIVFMNVAKGIIFQSNDIGRLIWMRIEAGKPLAAIIDEIVDQYKVGRKEAESDVCEYIEALKSQGLILEDSSLR